MFRGLCCGRELRSWYGGDHASGVIGIWHCHTPTCKQIKNGGFVGAMFFCDVVVGDSCGCRMEIRLCEEYVLEWFGFNCQVPSILELVET